MCVVLYPSKRQRLHHYSLSITLLLVVSSCRSFYNFVMNSHPLVATDCTDAVRQQFVASNSGSGGARGGVGKNHSKLVASETPSALENKIASVIAKCSPLIVTVSGCNNKGKEEGTRKSVKIRMDTVSLGRARLLRSNIVDTTHTSSKSSSDKSSSSVRCVTNVVPPSWMAPFTFPGELPVMSIPTRRHPTLVLQLPQPLGGPVQLHPRDSHAGLACMMDGSLALFYMPPMAFYESLPSSSSSSSSSSTKDTGEDKHPPETKMDDDSTMQKQWVMETLEEVERNRVGNLVYFVPPPSDETQYFITCAAFGKDGDIVWAVTK